MGTGRGDQEVLSEQRQNRGNLEHAPNYNTSCPQCLPYREAILISSGCCGEVLAGAPWDGSVQNSYFRPFNQELFFSQ